MFSKHTCISKEKHANVYAEIKILILGLNYIIPARYPCFPLRNAAAPGVDQSRWLKAQFDRGWEMGDMKQRKGEFLL